MTAVLQAPSVSSCDTAMASSSDPRLFPCLSVSEVRVVVLALTTPTSPSIALSLRCSTQLLISPEPKRSSFIKIFGELKRSKGTRVRMPTTTHGSSRETKTVKSEGIQDGHEAHAQKCRRPPMSFREGTKTVKRYLRDNVGNHPWVFKRGYRRSVTCEKTPTTNCGSSDTVRWHSHAIRHQIPICPELKESSFQKDGTLK